MTGKILIQAAEEKLFSAARVIETDQIVFLPEFRAFCEENYCGQYDANYSCPPICGTPEEMKARILRYRYALVLQSKWNIPDIQDKKAIYQAKLAHNQASHELKRRIEADCGESLLAGCGCCMLCTSCAMREGKACKELNERYSCMSAYCIYVKDLANKCGIEYDARDGVLPFFSLIAFEKDQ